MKGFRGPAVLRGWGLLGTVTEWRLRGGFRWPDDRGAGERALWRQSGVSPGSARNCPRPPSPVNPRRTHHTHQGRRANRKLAPANVKVNGTVTGPLASLQFRVLLQTLTLVMLSADVLRGEGFAGNKFPAATQTLVFSMGPRQGARVGSHPPTRVSP